MQAGPPEVIITGTPVDAGTWPWIVGAMALAIAYMAWHFVRRHEQDRTDRKEERAALLEVVRENAQVIKDNTAAMTELKSVVASVARSLELYIRQEH